jgi:ribosomal protein S18 acetylase RimI-like enzyme
VSTQTNLKMRIRICTRGDAATLAKLHGENISDRLGMTVLESYYRALVTSGHNFCLAAESEGMMLGYLGVLFARTELVEGMLGREFPRILAGLCQRPYLLPELLRRGWCWLRRSDPTAERCQPQVEYRPIVVAREYRGHGIAPRLMAQASEILARRGVDQVYLLVNRNNYSALRAYQRSGFTPELSSPSATIVMFKQLSCSDSVQPAQSDRTTCLHG